MKALQRAAWSLIFLVFGVRMAKAEAGNSRAEKDLYQIPEVDLRWKRMHSLGTREWKWNERALRKEEKEKRNSQGKDPRTFEGNSQGEQESFKEEGIKMKGGEVRKRKRMESGRQDRKRGKI